MIMTNILANINEVKEYLPFLIPLMVLEFGLLAYTIAHILRHDHYKRGNRLVWLIVSIVGMQFIGPILYFVLGKEED